MDLTPYLESAISELRFQMIKTLDTPVQECDDSVKFWKDMECDPAPDRMLRYQTAKYVRDEFETTREIWNFRIAGMITDLVTEVGAMSAEQKANIKVADISYHYEKRAWLHEWFFYLTLGFKAPA